MLVTMMVVPVACRPGIVHRSQQHVRIVHRDEMPVLQLFEMVDDHRPIVAVFNFHVDSFEFAVWRLIAVEVIVMSDSLENHVINAIFRDGCRRQNQPVCPLFDRQPDMPALTWLKRHVRNLRCPSTFSATTEFESCT